MEGYQSKAVIIVAGGKGMRMGSEIPKQFLPLCGKPVLMHTIDAFYHYDNSMMIVVVLPEEQQDFWKELCDRHSFRISHKIATGGKSRFHSVKNGLELLSDHTVVGIHDGVRPLISNETITQCYVVGGFKGAAFPVIPVTDTLRKKTGTGSQLVDRNEYCLVQTPQVFRSDIIKRAYKQEYNDSFTDDISVVEALGDVCVYEVPGDKENIKITTPADLMIAESVIVNRKSTYF